MKEKIDALIDGGKASAGPPLGPALGPMGVNISAVVNTINEKTKEFSGMKVPVTVIIDTGTKDYEVEIGSPPTSALIKKELGIEKGSGEARTDFVGNLKMDQAIKLARMKRDSMLAADLKAGVKEVLGVCVSMGITIEDKPPKVMLKEITDGEHDSEFTKE